MAGVSSTPITNQDGQCSQCLVYCLQNHFGSMNSGQNQDGQCSQCEEDLGSTGQIMDGQCSHSHYFQEPRLGHTGEKTQINQCNQCHSLLCPKLGNTREESWRIQIQSK
eukprot:2644515-Amphidinium_carterae.1